MPGIGTAALFIDHHAYAVTSLDFDQTFLQRPRTAIVRNFLVAGTPVFGEKAAPSFPDNGNGIVGLVNRSGIGTAWKSQQDCSHQCHANRFSDFHLPSAGTVNDILDSNTDHFDYMLPERQLEIPKSYAKLPSSYR